jgi:hypothetical protein
LVGLHGSWTVASVQDLHSFRVGLNAYLAGFQAEFRRIADDLRAGGTEGDAATTYVDSQDDEAVKEWLHVFAMSEHSGWETMVRDAMRTPRGSWLSGLFGRATG